jgi:hypothetical protein
MFPYTEAAWNAGQRKLAGDVVARTADRAYRRTDARQTKSIAPFKSALPPEYQYRIPGIANEFWALDEDNPGGCENYGWGATLPTLILRNVVGFREFEDPAKNAFLLAPALPSALMKAGETYEVRNVHLRTIKASVAFSVLDASNMNIRLQVSGKFRNIAAAEAEGKTLATANAHSGEAVLDFQAANDAVYKISFQL